MYQEISGAPWGKIFKKELFLNLRFPKDVTIAEDLYTVYHALLNTAKVSFCDDLSYAYILRQNSADSHYFDNKKMYSIDFVINDLIANKNYFKTIWEAVECRIVDLLFHVFMMMPKEHKSTPSIWGRIKELRLHVIRNSNARFKTRIACLMSYLGKNVVRYFFSFINKRK